MQVVALITAVFTLSLGITKAVDLVRNFVGTRWTSPRWVWNVVSFGFGLAFALGWGVDLTAGAISLVPALAGKSLSPVVGQIITGIALGGGSGFWHEVLDALSGIASANHAKAGEK